MIDAKTLLLAMNEIDDKMVMRADPTRREARQRSKAVTVLRALSAAAACCLVVLGAGLLFRIGETLQATPGGSDESAVTPSPLPEFSSHGDASLTESVLAGAENWDFSDVTIDENGALHYDDPVQQALYDAFILDDGSEGTDASPTPTPSPGPLEDGGKGTDAEDGEGTVQSRGETENESRVVRLVFPLVVQYRETSDGSFRTLCFLHRKNYAFSEENGVKVVRLVGSYADLAGATVNINDDVVSAGDVWYLAGDVWYPKDGELYKDSVLEYMGREGDEAFWEELFYRLMEQQIQIRSEERNELVDRLLLSFMEQNNMTGWQRKYVGETKYDENGDPYDESFCEPFGPQDESEDGADAY